jgi:hypothetical protein
MAKGQQKKSKEARKPNMANVKTNAANPSTKGPSGGLSKS